MKAYYISLITLLAQLVAGAQNQGTVTYKRTLKMKIDLDSATMAMIGNSFPSETSETRLLLFNDNEALYTTPPVKEDNTLVENEDGHHIEIRMDAGDEKVFLDLKNKRRIEQREFMGKKFLMDSAMVKSDWKMTGQQKTILNYPCQQAIKISDKDTVYAWFTPAIPVPAGPDGMGGLPGLILETQGHHGEISVIAQKVDTHAPDAKLMVKPKEGKKVTPHAFKKIMEERTKEMQKQYGGKDNVIIKIEQH